MCRLSPRARNRDLRHQARGHTCRCIESATAVGRCLGWWQSHAAVNSKGCSGATLLVRKVLGSWRAEAATSTGTVLLSRAWSCPPQLPSPGVDHRGTPTTIRGARKPGKAKRSCPIGDASRTKSRASGDLFTGSPRRTAIKATDDYCPRGSDCWLSLRSWDSPVF